MASTAMGCTEGRSEASVRVRQVLGGRRYSTSTAWRPPYQPQFGHTTWGALAWRHCVPGEWLEVELVAPERIRRLRVAVLLEQLTDLRLEAPGGPSGAPAALALPRRLDDPVGHHAPVDGLEGHVDGHLGAPGDVAGRHPQPVERPSP